MISCSSSAVAAAALDGFSPVALPWARLGAAFQSGSATGKFHGVTSAATPARRCRGHQQAFPSLNHPVLAPSATFP